MDEADITLVIEAMYQVAAEPERWEQLVEVLGDVPESAEIPAGAARGLAHSQEVARMLGRSKDGQAAPATPPSALGWVLLGKGRKVVAANGPAHAMMLNSGLGELRTDAQIGFHNPANEEALIGALESAKHKGSSHTILKLERDIETGPCFGYVVPARSLPGLVGPGIPQLILDDNSYAVVFPAEDQTVRLWSSLRESFGLTPAEVRLASRLREGLTLTEAAGEMALSINTVRNQLRSIFEKMGLSRQGDLIRALGDLSQMVGVLEGASPAPKTIEEPAPGISTIRLPDGRQLAYRDYGSPTGKVLLMFHEGLGSSLLPPGVQTLARGLGLRVISAERPGFGQSDPSDDYSFDSVADDMVELCNQLNLDEIRIVAVLSGGPSAIQTAIRLGDRAKGLLLCSARPPRATTKSAGLMTQFRQRLQSHPWVIETFYAVLRLRMSNGMTPRMVQVATSESPGDRAFLLGNPWVAEFMSTYVGETLARGSRGPSDEMKAFHRASNLTPADLHCPLIVWHGEFDHFAPLSDLLDYLGDKPHEVQVFPGMGHLLAIQRWADILHHVAA